MKKREIEAAFAKKFPGDKEAAKYFCSKYMEIEKIVDEIGTDAVTLLSKNDYISLMKIITTACMDIFGGIVLPIYYKFPELDESKKTDQKPQ